MYKAILPLLLVSLLVGCGGPRDYRPIETDKVVFWDRQTTEAADLLGGIIDDFNAKTDGLPVEAQYSGGYADIFRKVSVSIQAGTLPAMAVGYESMTAEYIRAGAVVPVDPFIEDPEIGLTPEDMDDFFPVVIETNRYPDFDNRMYSFPFSKSVLIMYFNRRVLAEAGINGPPETWDAFLEQCRQIRERTDKYAYAIHADASTVDGMIFSMGADVVDGKETLFDSPEALEVFRLHETLATERLAYQIPPGSYDDRDAFAQDRVAFVFRSSSHRAYFEQIMDGANDDWGIAQIPQADPQNPQTVLYGPNICIFNTTPEQQRRAWEFVRYFTSTDVTVEWSLGTGYLPIRKSAAAHPDMVAFFDEWEYNRVPFDCLAFARSEPNLAGWQEVRDLIEKAQTGVLSGRISADEAAAQLKRDADAVLASYAAF